MTPQRIQAVKPSSRINVTHCGPSFPVSCIHSFIDGFILTQFLSTRAEPGTVRELGITWSPFLEHNPLGDWLEKGTRDEMDQDCK